MKHYNRNPKTGRGGGNFALDFLARLVIRKWGGGRIVKRAIALYPEFFIKGLSNHFHADLSDFLPRIAPVRGFEDCAWMFAANPANRGVARLDFDEAALLFSLARDAQTIGEIGRFRGGSTFLFAVASPQDARVTSIDILPPADDVLRDALSRAQVLEKVDLVVADANQLEVKTDRFDLFFIDGDHEYAGVKRDFERWKSAVRPGGHLIFHDAARGRAFASAAKGPAQLMTEIERDESAFYKRLPDAGSVAHFLRTGKPYV